MVAFFMYQALYTIRQESDYYLFYNSTAAQTARSVFLIELEKGIIRSIRDL